MQGMNRYLDFANELIAKYQGFGGSYGPIAMLYLQDEKAEESEELRAQQNFITNFYKIQNIREENHLYTQNLTFLTNILEKRFQQTLYPSVEKQVEKMVREEFREATKETVRTFAQVIQHFVEKEGADRLEVLRERLLKNENQKESKTQKEQEILFRKLQNIYQSSSYGKITAKNYETNQLSVKNQVFQQQLIHQEQTIKNQNFQQSQNLFYQQLQETEPEKISSTTHTELLERWTETLISQEIYRETEKLVEKQLGQVSKEVIRELYPKLMTAQTAKVVISEVKDAAKLVEQRAVQLTENIVKNYQSVQMQQNIFNQQTLQKHHSQETVLNYHNEGHVSEQQNLLIHHELENNQMLVTQQEFQKNQNVLIQKSIENVQKAEHQQTVFNVNNIQNQQNIRNHHSQETVLNYHSEGNVPGQQELQMHQMIQNQQEHDTNQSNQSMLVQQEIKKQQDTLTQKNTETQQKIENLQTELKQQITEQSFPNIQNIHNIQNQHTIFNVSNIQDHHNLLKQKNLQSILNQYSPVSVLNYHSEGDAPGQQELQMHQMIQHQQEQYTNQSNQSMLVQQEIKKQQDTLIQKNTETQQKIENLQTELKQQITEQSFPNIQNIHNIQNQHTIFNVSNIQNHHNLLKQKNLQSILSQNSLVSVLNYHSEGDVISQQELQPSVVPGQILRTSAMEPAAMIYSDENASEREQKAEVVKLQKQVDEVVRDLKTVEEKNISRRKEVTVQQKELIKEIIQTSPAVWTEGSGQDAIRREVQRTLEQKIPENIDRITTKVYRRLEEKLKMERGRRGMN